VACRFREGHVVTTRLEGPHVAPVVGHIVEFGRYGLLSWGLVAASPPEDTLPGDGFHYRMVKPHGDDGPWEATFTRTVSVCRCIDGETEEQQVRRSLWRTADGRRWEQHRIGSGDSWPMDSDLLWSHVTAATADLGLADDVSHLLRSAS
jgi:hypothetical protein